MQNKLNPISTFTLKTTPLDQNMALITIDPLDKGYGHTLGNALRRVMLSSLGGVAFSSVRIVGADHPFSVVGGMSEDVLDLTLNLKLVRLKAIGDGPWIARLHAKGAKVVTAADFECEGGLEVINPEQHIATLDKGGELELEAVAEMGTGYIQATEKKTNTIGEIALDSLYSPVIMVSYSVDSTRVGRRTDYDKLLMEVTTDGSLTPLEAVQQAAKILVAQFNQVINPAVVKEPDKSPTLSPEEQEVLRLTVEELDLPTRIANALRKGGFKTVGDLKDAPRSIVVKVKNLGEKSIEIVEQALAQKGVCLVD